MSAEEALEQAKKMQTGSFDFNDFLAQTQMMRRMGGLKGMLKNMPGGICVFACVYRTCIVWMGSKLAQQHVQCVFVG